MKNYSDNLTFTQYESLQQTMMATERILNRTYQNLAELQDHPESHLIDFKAIEPVVHEIKNILLAEVQWAFIDDENSLSGDNRDEIEKWMVMIDKNTKLQLGQLLGNYSLAGKEGTYD